MGSQTIMIITSGAFKMGSHYAACSSRGYWASAGHEGHRIFKGECGLGRELGECEIGPFHSWERLLHSPRYIVTLLTNPISYCFTEAVTSICPEVTFWLQLDMHSPVSYLGT